MEFFVPEKLIEERRRIQKVHAERSQIRFEADEEMETLIRRLYRCDESMVKATALSLTERQADMLAGYLPYNFYEQDEERLFDIMKFRLDRRTSRVLYRQWQEAFRNPECNRFLMEEALFDPSFSGMLEEYGIHPDTFRTVLQSANIALGFDEELVGRHFADGADFDRKLKSHGVVEQSLLDVECKRALLTFCGKADYLNCSQENLLDIIRSYDFFMLRKFLLNFMKKLSLAELQVYPELAAYLRSVIGHRKTETFRTFFDGVDQAQVQKYIDWINIFKLNIYFDNDERSRFWKQFRYVNVIRYPASNTLVLEFENHVAVEFLGDDKGTIYICEKEPFRQNFYTQLNSMDNEDIRLYFRVHRDICMEYRNHTARWQAHVSSLITRKQITEKVPI